MHNEDISQRVATLREQIQEAHDAAARVAEKNNIMIDKLDTTYQSVVESSRLITELDEAVTDLA
jgi:uncharacterized coiled-coil DUF342 family protein